MRLYGKRWSIEVFFKCCGELEDISHVASLALLLEKLKSALRNGADGERTGRTVQRVRKNGASLPEEKSGRFLGFFPVITTGFGFQGPANVEFMISPPKKPKHTHNASSHRRNFIPLRSSVRSPVHFFANASPLLEEKRDAVFSRGSKKFVDPLLLQWASAGPRLSPNNDPIDSRKVDAPQRTYKRLKGDKTNRAWNLLDQVDTKGNISVFDACTKPKVRQRGGVSTPE